MMNREHYHRLGDYIRLVDVRNRELAVTKLLGVSISKTFIPSIANTIGTDMSTYKIVEPYQFAYGPVTSRNGDKITFALYKGEEKCIVSSAYVTFDIIDKERLDPDYLMMWALRPEFDRYARFMSNGSAREIFSWEDMCDVYLPVPDIDVQRRIVAEYQAVEARIATNERLIAKLEDTSQSIYKSLFVDNIDQENLPEGWRLGLLSEMGNVITGKTPSSECPEDFGSEYPFITPGDFSESERFMVSTERYLSSTGIEKLKTKVLGYGDVAVTCIGYVGKVAIVSETSITNQQINSIKVYDKSYTDYLFKYLKSITQVLVNAAVGSSTLPLLNKTDFEKIPVLIPDSSVLNNYSELMKPIAKDILLREKENNKLKELLGILLSRLASR